MIKKMTTMKTKPNKAAYLLIALLFLMCLPAGMMAQNRQKKDTVQRKENIKASEYMIPKRRGAEVRIKEGNGTSVLLSRCGYDKTLRHGKQIRRPRSESIAVCGQLDNAGHRHPWRGGLQYVAG